MDAREALEEAKARYGVEKNKVVTALTAVAGSRGLMAILATFALAFGTHAVFSPQRLPSVSGLSASQAGLPPNLDFGLVGEQAVEAIEAAKREDVPGRLETFIAEGADASDNFLPMLNWIGFGATFALLLGNLWIMTKRRRVSRG